MEFFKKLFEKLGLKEGAAEADVLAAVDTIVAKIMIFTKETLSALGLKEGAGDKDIQGAITTIAAKAMGIPKEVLDVLELADGSNASTVVASINALKQAPKGMVTRAEFDAVVAKQKQRDADEAVAAALNEGKITPDQKDWADKYAMTDLAGFQIFVAKAPVVIPMDKLPKQDKKGDAVVDETTLAIGKLFGNTAEDIKKYSGIQA
jgi:phage I-like protein